MNKLVAVIGCLGLAAVNAYACSRLELREGLRRIDKEVNAARKQFKGDTVHTVDMQTALLDFYGSVSIYLYYPPHKTAFVAALEAAIEKASKEPAHA